MNFPSKNQLNATESPGLLFIKAYNNWHTEIKKQLKKIDLTHPQFVVMASLGYLSQHDEEVTQVMIATLAEMDVMTTSQILTLLDKKGWIIRRTHATDTRAKAIELTTEGHHMLTKALPIVETIDAHYFACLEAEQESFKTNLRQLAAYSFGEK
ncbi:MarR family winged helix-turn-helix transcriptional regulator [Isobaculum melis]|uniref:DNA-binding transcriptional regulator, MarR family n=1 Tax=Isobaculum melis TaxID=142588 RepID=A0A1H9STI2_9LACT|nr:MarR family transcriptional regulator [Isobaculum melis]SER88208.1 DNA-binding transcriptional regulator, MarR family [Isobaculum melis]